MGTFEWLATKTTGLFISVKTVAGQQTSIRQKLRVSTPGIPVRPTIRHVMLGS
jgi:DNA-binding CsgD family transcriptional regulator